MGSEYFKKYRNIHREHLNKYAREYYRKNKNVLFKKRYIKYIGELEDYKRRLDILLNTNEITFDD